MSETVTVLGAGIQGTCVALMLQKRGFRVRLVDKAADLITRASLSMEGKIHVGFVYGMDKSLETGRRMVRDALHFAPCLETLLDQKPAWRELCSTRNVYAVVRGSMLSRSEVEDYFRSLDGLFRELLASSDLHYMGRRPASIFTPIETPAYLDRDRVDAAFLTEEISVDQGRMKRLIGEKVTNCPRIETFFGHHVESIERRHGGFVVSTRVGDGAAHVFESDLVANCLWESRVRFDRTMGLEEPVQYSLRLKYGLLLRLTNSLRSLDSLTLVHGPYGNMVVHPGSGTAFCSWYPASMKGLMEYGELPAEWERACDGLISAETMRALGDANFEGFRAFVPGLAKLDVIRATAGVILAEGTRDISERDSLFHARIEPPIQGRDGYYSINTSKYTSAPRNTMLLEQQLS